jgi:hypothetical protein
MELFSESSGLSAAISTPTAFNGRVVSLFEVL